jgi:hypothetical protein
MDYAIRNESLRMKLDLQTLKDLEIFQTSHNGTSIFDLCNHTRTKGGRRAFKSRFESPFSDPEVIRSEQATIRFFCPLSSKISFPLTQVELDHLERYLGTSFFLTPRYAGIMGHLQSRYLEVSNKAFAQFTREGVYGTLDLWKKIQPFLEEISRKSGIPTKIQQIIRTFASIDEQLPIPSRQLHHQGMALSFNDILDLDWHFRGPLKEPLMQFLEHLSETDCYLAMAKATVDQDFVFPIILDTPETTLQIKEVFHPFVGTPRKNPFSNADNTHVFLVTGPNMAGKTTYLKACLLSVVFAQMGMGVPASHMELTPFSHVFCTLSSLDDIREGVSSFCAEIRRVKQVLEAISPQERLIAVFDELFKGTNVIDRSFGDREIISPETMN